MQRNTNNKPPPHLNTPPPLPPPLSISLPASTRPKPDSIPKPKPPLTRPEPEPIPKSKPALPKPEPKHETAIVPVVEKYYSPLTSPLPVTPDSLPALPPPPQTVQLGGGGGGGGGERKARGVRFGGAEDVVRRSKKDEVVNKVGLGIRVLEIVFCLVCFSVMAADQTQGWSGDSFYRYKEYRFCLTVAIFGFVYSAFQTYDLGSYIATGKHVITHRFRHQFDFSMDQILAYLLISALSASASRVDDWQINWGKDEFTQKASASISMAFLAFICFAMSSLISGHNLCNRDLY